jgi:hypothetical protein
MPPFTTGSTFKRTLPISLVVFFVALVNLIVIYRYIPYDNKPDIKIPPPSEEKPELPPYDPPHYGLSLVRPKERRFTSPIIEKFLKSLGTTMKDKDLYILLQNCLPNTLDTTVEWVNENKKDPRSFLITGDSNVKRERDREEGH